MKLEIGKNKLKMKSGSMRKLDLSANWGMSPKMYFPTPLNINNCRNISHFRYKEMEKNLLI